MHARELRPEIHLLMRAASAFRTSILPNANTMLGEALNPRF
jgi:hypothetical protein